ncbi:MAG: alpha/beta fold hydrolase [Acidiferrobacterales bacterium]|nr:alpha/beta fold hydrolase [Acidiferrobacterales bacterium]
MSPPLVMIPGLFGSIANWRSVAKKLSSQSPVIVIDQRNHGRSPHAESHSYLDMVEDLRGFVEQHAISKIILCGHSMGGKVAMLFALLHPENVEKLAVLDIAPVTYQHSHAPFLAELLKVDLAQLQSRRDADRILETVIPEDGTRLFLLQSLAGTAGSFYWRINLPVLLDFMPQIVGFPDASVTDLHSTCESLLISGGASNYVTEAGRQKFHNYFSDTHDLVIEGAGHWLHAEQPNSVIEALSKLIISEK